MNKSEEEILFYHNKFVVSMKVVLSIIICVSFIIIPIDINRKSITSNFLGYILSIIFFSSFFYGFGVTEDILVHLFLKLSSEKITYYYLFLGNMNTDISFYWKDIIKIEKANILFYKRIRIIYQDKIDNKIRKCMIKVKNSKNSYEEIYDTLIMKLEEYKKSKVS